MRDYTVTENERKLQRSLDEPDEKSVWAGAAVSALLPTVFESPLFPWRLSWWIYGLMVVFCLLASYLSYRDDKVNIESTA